MVAREQRAGPADSPQTVGQHTLQSDVQNLMASMTEEPTAKRARVDAALTMATRGADNDTALYNAAAKGDDALARTLLQTRPRALA